MGTPLGRTSERVRTSEHDEMALGFVFRVQGLAFSVDRWEALGSGVLTCRVEESQRAHESP